MKKGILFIGLFLILAFSQIAHAQTTAFTYQGSLNHNGAPANGNFDFVVGVFDAAEGGTELGTFFNLNVPVTNGVFSLTINMIAPFTGAERFLEIQVRQSGATGGPMTILSPRQRVTSTPYALKSRSSAISDNALQLGGFAAADYIRQGSDTITAGTQFNIGGFRVLAASGGNTFVGRNAGTSNIFPGFSNSFFGNRAGEFNTVGSSNSFFGSQAGGQNDTGTENSFFGAGAGSTNTSGEKNSFFGTVAGSSNTNGNNNAFFGNKAGLNNTSGNENAFFGSSSGFQNSTGEFNSFFGSDAGINNLNGSYNSFFGAFSRGGNGLVNATAIGFRAFVSQSNSLVLGSINGENFATVDTNVGIGTSEPTHRLTIGKPETPVNAGAKVAIYGADLADIILRDTTDDVEGVFSANTGRVVIGALTNSELQFRTNNTTRMTIAPSGAVAFNVLGSAGTTPLCRNASHEISTCSSSIRYKTNVNQFRSGLSLVTKLRPVSFNWKANNLADMGLVAEEVNKVEPLLTTVNEKGEVEGVKYDRVGVVLVNAVQEQQAQIEAQQKQIDEQKEIIRRQEEKLNRQQSELDALRRLVCSQNKDAEICRPGN